MSTAYCPTYISSPKLTTLGVIRSPKSFGITSGWSFEFTYDTTLKVLPKSIPIAYPII